MQHGFFCTRTLKPVSRSYLIHAITDGNPLTTSHLGEQPHMGRHMGQKYPWDSLGVSQRMLWFSFGVSQFGESGFPKISGWFPGSMRLYESPFNLMKPQIPSSKDCLSQILERAAPRASGCKSSQAFGKTRGELCRGVSKRQSWERSKCQHVTHPSNVVQYSTMCPKMLEVCQSLLQALLVRSCEFDAGHN